MPRPTPDLCDLYPEKIRIATPLFSTYGGRPQFEGEIATVKCFEDNSLVRDVLGEPGNGRVLVVDGGGSMRRALLGDMLAAMAVSNGWSGVIINGCLRDVDEINTMDLGVRALGAHPMKTDKRGEGQSAIAVRFADVEWRPGAYVYADNNGIIVTPKKLSG